MIDWRAHWNAVAPADQPADLLRQVGKTVERRPVASAVIDAIVTDIAGALALNSNDSLLDLGCGNGLLTARCATRCARVTGVDFSMPLLATAREWSARDNVTYVLCDVRDLRPELVTQGYTKILMYEALQHFAAEDLHRLLDRLAHPGTRGATIMLGSVPNRDRIHSFYDTDERQREYERRVREGTEAIGHWWTTNELSEIAARHAYDVAFRPQGATHTRHYRFDAVLTP